jgi:putative membrane protein
VTWFAALFYLPRLFVYHAMCEDEQGNARFKIMERKLYYGIMMPSAVFVLIFGLWLLSFYSLEQIAGMHWIHAKLLLVAILYGYHFKCGSMVKQFANDTNDKTHKYYRWFNEFPVIILIAVVILAVVRPF